MAGAKATQWRDCFLIVFQWRTTCVFPDWLSCFLMLPLWARVATFTTHKEFTSIVSQTSHLDAGCLPLCSKIGFSRFCTQTCQDKMMSENETCRCHDAWTSYNMLKLVYLAIFWANQRRKGLSRVSFMSSGLQYSQSILRATYKFEICKINLGKKAA